MKRKHRHYIWNRAERVDKKLMPQVVVDAFNEWQKGELRGLKSMTEDYRDKTIARVNRQRKQMEQNLASLGYEVN